jgi:transposase
MPREMDGILNLPGYEVVNIEGVNPVVIRARYTGAVRCPACESSNLRRKDRFVRRLHHESVGTRKCYLWLEARKFQCLDCGRYFHQRFPGILPYRRTTEGYRREVFEQHRDGICQTRLAERGRIGTATVERWFHDYLERKVAELAAAACPRVLGIDEHFFSRKDGYATTLCDLGNHRVYDVVLGRSEAALRTYFTRLKDPQGVRVVCMDLASSYRMLVRQHLPQARIVADRFHVIRLINQHFLATWKLVDPIGGRHRGLLSLMRRHAWTLSPVQQLRLSDYLSRQPALAVIYEFKQRLARLMLTKHRTKRGCRRLVRVLLHYIDQLRSSGFDPLRTLGQTLWTWREEVACMWRFTKNNGITEGFHNKMEMISRRAYGFKNFENYRLRVRALCA